MATQWYYQVMGEEVGPVSPSELREKAASGQITAETLVRKGVDASWVGAERVKGLFTSPTSPKVERSSATVNDGNVEDDVMSWVGESVIPKRDQPQAAPVEPRHEQRQSRPPVQAGQRLQACPDCGKMVSKRARQCPDCGCPIGSTEQPVGVAKQAVGIGKTEVLVEQTAKKYKAMQLCAVLGILLSVCVLFLGTLSPLFSVVGMLGLVVGLVVWVYARFVAWWHHG